MIHRIDIWMQVLRHPLVPLVPVMSFVLCLAMGLAVIHGLIVIPVEQRATELQKEWREARYRFFRHVQAKRVQQDLGEVLRMIPTKRGFVPLALEITNRAERNNVVIPSLSYRMEASKGSLATKAVFQGSATGRYQDLRRFIRQLEATKELLFIEDLDVVRSGVRENRQVTFKMRIATYLRPSQGRTTES